METKTKIVIIAGAFATLAILLFVGFYFKDKTGMVEKQEESENQEITLENKEKSQKQAIDFGNIVNFSNNPEDCYQLEEHVLILECERLIKTKTIRMAVAENDPAICDKEKSKERVTECRVYFEYNDFLSKKEIASCEGISDENEKIFCKQKEFTIQDFISGKK